jgi:hypothetical protein
MGLIAHSGLTFKVRSRRVLREGFQGFGSREEISGLETRGLGFRAGGLGFRV